MNDLIRNQQLIRNFNDLTGLRFGNMYPTDIDGFMEIRNKLFIFIETKFDGAPMPFGQETALVHLVDSLHNPDKEKFAYCLVVSHASNSDIDVASCLVTQYRVGGKWVDVAELGYTTYDFVYNLIGIHIGHDKI